MKYVRSEKNSGPNKTRPPNLTRRAAQCSISETYIRKRGHVGACGKPFQTGNFSPEKGIGDSAPSRSRLGPGVKEAESLGGRRQPRRSRWHSDGQTGDCKQKLLHSGVRFQLSQFMQRFTNPGDWSTSFLDILGSEKWHTFESNYVCPFLQPVRRQRCFFTLGEVVLRFPPGSPLGTFIAVRSAPDPTLDMDLRVGNFLLVE